MIKTFVHSADWNSCVSPGQVQHSLQGVGAIFGTRFTEQSVVRLLREDRNHKPTLSNRLGVLTWINWIKLE